MQYVVLLITWLSIAAVTPALGAGQSRSSFSVAGTLIPGACRLEFANGGRLMLEEMSIAEVNKRNGMQAEREIAFQVYCDDKMQTRFTVSDEYRSSATQPNPSAYTLVDTQSGVMIGNFELLVKNVTADGVSVGLYNNNNWQSSAHLSIDTEYVFMSALTKNLALGIPEASEAEVISGTLSVFTTLNPGIKANTKINYIGTANFTLKYD
ncbi:hypothetical protein [Pseudomonas chlororaphis]|uniref:hypothetical protein n=1 Tax=Pseudomonas chlororaphis TaxID=587753 RepID=UPI0011846E75|nr:hypothetical protein [Pseudomonas chlororaphis]